MSIIFLLLVYISTILYWETIIRAVIIPINSAFVDKIKSLFTPIVNSVGITISTSIYIAAAIVYLFSYLTELSV